jgi:thioredoxin 1
LTIAACTAGLPQGPAATVAGDTVSRIRPANVPAEPAEADDAVSRIPDDRTVIPITDDQFEQEILKSPEPAVVVFWAPWCGPCRGLINSNWVGGVETFGPLEQLGQRFQGRVRIRTINTDHYQQTALRLGTMAIPLMVSFKNGQIVDRIEGKGPLDYYVPRFEHLASR